MLTCFVVVTDEPVSFESERFQSGLRHNPGKFFWRPKSSLKGSGKLVEEVEINMVGAWGFEPQTPTVSR
jgi:hypothetical protein